MKIMINACPFARLPLTLLLVCACAVLGPVAQAETPRRGDWVASPHSRFLPGQEDTGGKTYFSKTFGKKSGTFKAVYDSLFDKRDKVTGDFIIGSYRYTYEAPNGEADSKIYPLHDEDIETVLLDCKNGFVGSISSIYLLRGEVVRKTEYSDKDVEVTQMRLANTTVGDLCRFAKQQGVW
jgi:hypothetical protein